MCEREMGGCSELKKKHRLIQQYKDYDGVAYTYNTAIFVMPYVIASKYIDFQTFPFEPNQLMYDSNRFFH